MDYAIVTPTDTTSCRITNADMAAAATLRTLDAYRCALYDAQQASAMPPAPPALTADETVNAYGKAMSQYGATYMPFTEWYAKQQTPQPPRRFVVIGHTE